MIPTTSLFDWSADVCCFFSSRRRHTRSLCDWSSDVCSSDLWEGRQGVDLNPKADGPERRIFIEHIDFQTIDPQANGPQLFYGLRYHIRITTREEDITFHEQVGHWLWEPATGLVLQ